MAQVAHVAGNLRRGFFERLNLAGNFRGEIGMKPGIEHGLVRASAEINGGVGHAAWWREGWNGRNGKGGFEVRLLRFVVPRLRGKWRGDI